MATARYKPNPSKSLVLPLFPKGGRPPPAKIRYQSMQSTLWLAGYESDGEHLSLDGFIQQAGTTIRRHYNFYLASRTGAPFDDFWEDIRQDAYWKRPGRRASELAKWVAVSVPTGPTGYGPLYVAGAFYWDALQASQNKLPDRAWAALLMCHHFLGMAYGQESMIKPSSKGGSKTSAPFAEFNDSFRKELLSWLGGLVAHPPRKKLQSVRAVIDELLPKAIAFRNKWSEEREDSRGRSQNLGVLMRDLSSDPKVRAAFEAVMGRPIGKGRPPGEAKDVASKKKKKGSIGA